MANLTALLLGAAVLYWTFGRPIFISQGHTPPPPFDPAAVRHGEPRAVPSWVRQLSKMWG